MSGCSSPRRCVWLAWSRLDPRSHAGPGSDGTLDTAFSTNTGTGFNGNVESVAVQTDGKIVVGGSFTAVNGVTSNRIARLNADGSVDTAFSANLGAGPSDDVKSVAVQSDGRIVIGGWFTAVNGTPSARIARLNDNGSVDTAFSANTGTGFDFDVSSVALQAGNKIVVGGGFTAVNGTLSKRLARLNSNGSVDTAFSTNIGTGFNDDVESIAVQGDDKIVVGGYFFNVNGTTSYYLARLNANGSLDAAFSTAMGIGPSGPLFAVAVQPDGKVLAGGTLTNISGTVSAGIARLNDNGSVDTAFSSNLGTGFDGSPRTLAVQADGKVLVGGNFTKINGIPSKSIARLNSNGSTRRRVQQ